MIKNFSSRGFTDDGYYVEVREVRFLGILIYRHQFVDELTTADMLKASAPKVGFTEPADE